MKKALEEERGTVGEGITIWPRRFGFQHSLLPVHLVKIGMFVILPFWRKLGGINFHYCRL